MPIGWAILGSAVIGAVGSNMAAGTQADAQTNAANMQQRNLNTVQGNLAPFIAGGPAAMTNLSQFMGTGGDPNAANYGQGTRSFSPTDFLNNKDPGYQFQLQTGAAATRNADTPGVGSLSGAALKDLTSFNQNMAATGYQTAFNRFQTQNDAIYGRLSGLAGLSESAAAGAGFAGAPYGASAAGLTAAAGGSRAGGIVGATNAIGGNAIPLGYLMANQTPSNESLGFPAANSASNTYAGSTPGPWAPADTAVSGV